jgi:hypothetical protein
MLIPEITATRFEKVMGSGRTQPCLLACEDAEGNEVEVVVKLRHANLSGGLAAEAMAALYAFDLDLPVGKIHKVKIENEFIKSIPNDNIRLVFEKSGRENFGTVKWSPGYTIWLRHQFIPDSLRQTAMEVFAFDGIIQNPDRRASNPNCVFSGDSIILYDHESAFSNFRNIFPTNPWEPGGMNFLSIPEKEHVFWSALRGKILELDRLQGAMEAVDKDRFAQYLSVIPENWNGTAVTAQKIAGYLQICAHRFDEIKQQLQGIL